VGVRRDGTDRVVTSDTAERLGVPLGFRDRLVLARLEQRAREARVRSASPGFALVDLKGVHRLGGEHRPVVYRYGILADTASGAVTTLLWGIRHDPGRDPGEVFSPLIELPPNFHRRALLYVDPSGMLFGIPSETAFAAAALPQGRRAVPLPADLADDAGRLDPDPAELRRIEGRLRTTLAAP
jgi:hypothetical protein